MGICKFCNKEFLRDSTLSSHVCEQKRRHNARNEKHSVIALNAFVKFYELSSPLSSGKKTFDDFVKSPYYNGFIKFGSFVNNIKPLYPEKYIDYLIKNSIHLDKWCKDSVYDKYVISLIYTESVQTALERSVMTMQKWADENGSEWNKYFDDVNLNVAYYHIKDGKISPWLLINAAGGMRLLSRFRDDQLNTINTVLDADKWVNIFNSKPDDVEFVNNIVEAANL